MSRFPWVSVLLIIAPVALAAAFLQGYRLTFGFDWAIVSLGVSLVAGVLCAITAAVHLVPIPWIGRASGGAYILLTVCLALFLTTVPLIYLGAALSNAMWGDTLDYKIAATFVFQPRAVLAFLPLTEAGRHGVLIGLVLSGAVYLTLVIWAAARLARALLTESIRIGKSEMFGQVRKRPIFAAALLVFAVFSGWKASAIAISETAAAQGEPISGFLGLRPSTNLAQLDNVRLAVALQDQLSRKDYPRAAPPEPKNVILLFSDALRADRMGVYGYNRQTTPFLSRLHASGRLHRVDMALSTCSESYCGIASTLAARPYHELSPYNHKLHEVMRDVGYKVNFYLSGDHTTWRNLRDFYGNDIDNFNTVLSGEGRDIHDDENVIKALEKLEPYAGKPHFLYFFLMTTHILGTKKPEFEQFKPTDLDGARLMTFWNQIAGMRRIDGKMVGASDRLSDADMQAIRNRYDNGMLQSDHYMERIFAKLEAKGYLKNAIVVILGDHGEGLGEHGHIGHTRFLFQEDIRIPLLIYDEDISKYRNSSFGLQLDVGPTILNRLGLPVPAGWRGHSLLEPPQDRISIHQTRRGGNTCYAAVSRTSTSLHKYIRCGLAAVDVRESLFDLVVDPAERNDLIDQAATRQEVRQTLELLRREIRSRFAVTRNSCNEELCLN